MSLAVVLSRAEVGIDAPPVAVEVHLSGGLPCFSIVGLPEAVVKESKDRVRSAIINSRFDFPRGRITVSLAPADLPKDGGRFDLPIAIGILAASKQINAGNVAELEWVGELALGGAVRPIKGTLSAVIAATHQARTMIVPHDNLAEAALVPTADILGAAHLLETTAYLDGQHSLSAPVAPPPPSQQAAGVDLADVQGQPFAKRALEIAAAGGHSLLMLGSPGTGKTMLAMRLPGILPTMSQAEALENATVQSASHRGFDIATFKQRPFRAPHHSASGAALVGGGSYPRPGEISLAHRGVLFLDELPEFDRRVLEQLREPLESGVIHISRAARQVEYPARFQLIAAMNPCPCGYLGDASRECRCSADQVHRYIARISGPLLDRIDLHVRVPSVPRQALRRTDINTETTHTVRNRVSAVWQRQLDRQGALNNTLTGQRLQRFVTLDDACESLIDRAMEKLNLSARSYHRILRVARTIADMDDSDRIESNHVAEAIHLRCLDRR